MAFFILWFIVPSAIFVRLRGSWSFTEALYFCFVTLTTIGYGDYTVSNTANNYEKNGAFDMVVILWLLSGFVATSIIMGRAANLVHGSLRNMQGLSTEEGTRKGRRSLSPAEETSEVSIFINQDTTSDSDYVQVVLPRRPSFE